jgi:hypothetical protein
MDETASNDTFADSAPVEEAPVKRNIPLKKVAEAPYQQAGILANAVYLSRPGDTIESISQKIYGSDRSSELYKVNPTFRGRKLAVGSKVYYNSPNRPDDNTKLLTYYEDIGLTPEIYVSKDGDNIRTVATSLLGDANSWKEIWATNPDVESKGELAGGMQLRYWTASESAPALASAPPAPEANINDMGNPPPPSDMAMNDLNAPAAPPAEPPPQQMAQNDQQQQDDLAVPPPSEGTVEPPPPPPPPSAAVVEPPPPPPPAIEPNRAAAKAESAQDETMILGAGVVLLVAAVALFIVRKKKARRQLDFNTSTQTQIE